MATTEHPQSVWIVLTLTLICVCAYATEEYNAAEGQIVCYECFNIVDGVFQPHCPKNGTVGPWTWKVNCTGKCFTRTDDQIPDLIYRGCSDNQPFLPDPLPEDGCYKFYLEEWCVCGKSGCNGVAMETVQTSFLITSTNGHPRFTSGKPKNIELDAHLPKEPPKTNSAVNILYTPFTIFSTIITFIL